MKLKSVLGSLVLMAAFAGTPALAQKSANTLRWASTFPITAIDPYYNFHREAMLLNGQLVWDTLIYRNMETGQYEPLLAKAWRWVDDVTLEFQLRDDIKFHDGIPLTDRKSVV